MLKDTTQPSPKSEDLLRPANIVKDNGTTQDAKVDAKHLKHSFFAINRNTNETLYVYIIKLY